MEASFRKDLGHLTWDEVLQRQVQRGPLVPAWLDALRLRSGMRVLDVGAGPGYVSRRVAQRVGPEGLVLAIDSAPEAVAYLERLCSEEGLTQIRPILADAATVDLRGDEVQAALVTMMLHHAEDPEALLRNLGRSLAPGVLAVVAEFHPDGPGTSGPPREHRVRPGQVQFWCERAGFARLVYRRQSPEHYMVIVQRTSCITRQEPGH